MPSSNSNSAKKAPQGPQFKDGIRKRGKRRDGSPKWEARVPDPRKAGNQISRVFRSADEAKDWRDEQRMTQRRGGWIDPNLGDQTFAALAEQWRASWIADVKPRTRHGYEFYLRVYLVPRFGRTAVAKITAPVVQSYIAQLCSGDYPHAKQASKDGEPAPAQPLAPETVRHIFASLRAAMAVAVRQGMIAKNPCEAVAAPSRRIRKKAILTGPQLMTLASAMPTERDRVVVLIAGITGLRAGEIWALRRDDVDLKRGTLRVDEAVTDVAGKLDFDEPKTRNSLRVVPLRGQLRDALVRHIGDIGLGDTDELLFKDQRGGPMSHSNWYARVFAPAAKAALPEKPSLRFHDLRHTAATIMVHLGASAKEVQMILGHASIQTTYDVYAGLFEVATERTADRMNEEVFGAAPPEAQVIPIGVGR